MNRNKNRQLSMLSRTLFQFLILISVTLSSVFVFTGCPREDIRSSDPEKESWTTGKLSVYCDDAIYPIMDSVFKMYDQMYPDVKLTVEHTNAWDVMAKLLSANARVVVVARDYLHHEDSLMKVFHVAPYLRMTLAFDGLVFFTNTNFPLDTLNASQIEEILTDREKKFLDYYPNLAAEPELAVMGKTSSEYANLRSLAAKGKDIVRKLRYFEGTDSLRSYVSENDNTIGVAFLSQLVNDSRFKMLRIGFSDSTGKYINPKPVHQAYLVQNLYPYKVEYYAYLLKDLRDLPFWFATFLAKEVVVQKYFNRSGIVPAFAIIELIPED